MKELTAITATLAAVKTEQFEVVAAILVACVVVTGFSAFSRISANG